MCWWREALYFVLLTQQKPPEKFEPPHGLDFLFPVTNKSFSAKVLTVSDGVSQGTREDKSGVALVGYLEEKGFLVVEHRVCADGVESVSSALRDLVTGFAGVVLTTGGIDQSRHRRRPIGCGYSGGNSVSSIDGNGESRTLYFGVIGNH